MKLKDYKKTIDRLVKEGHGDKDVIFSSDNEGNFYDDVFYSPSVIAIDGLEYRGSAKVTAICIN